MDQCVTKIYSCSGHCFLLSWKPQRSAPLERTLDNLGTEPCCTVKISDTWNSVTARRIVQPAQLTGRECIVYHRFFVFRMYPVQIPAFLRFSWLYSVPSDQFPGNIKICNISLDTQFKLGSPTCRQLGKQEN
jgi:hypothetical protein